MKSFFVWALLLLSLVSNICLWLRVTKSGETRAPATAEVAPADYPLGEEMGYLQRYADKLWFAGKQGDWELAKFYQGEITETAEAIAHAKVTRDGIAVSALLESHLPASMEGLSQALDARDRGRFETSYRAMVDSCNACHMAAEHSFIRVAVPSGPPTHWNQKFGGIGHGG